MQRRGLGEDSRGARNAKWTKQPSNGRGRDAIGRLFVLYSYYWLLSLLFLLLTSSFTLKALNPELELAGQPVHLLTRFLAWVLTAVTIPILIIRLRKRWADRTKAANIMGPK